MGPVLYNTKSFFTFVYLCNFTIGEGALIAGQGYALLSSSVTRKAPLSKVSLIKTRSRIFSATRVYGIGIVIELGEIALTMQYRCALERFLKLFRSHRLAKTDCKLRLTKILYTLHLYGFVLRQVRASFLRLFLETIISPFII
jgi:hypothetical protein